MSGLNLNVFTTCVQNKSAGHAHKRLCSVFAYSLFSTLFSLIRRHFLKKEGFRHNISVFSKAKVKV